MEQTALVGIVNSFDIKSSDVHVRPLGNGLINNTYLAVCDKKYVLQRVNTNVFKQPQEVMSNIFAVTGHIKAKGGKTLSFVHAKDGKEFYRDETGFYRLYEFVPDSKSYDVVTAELFEEAAYQFGKFQNYLSDFDTSKLCDTIPDFHNTAKRVENFIARVKKDEFSRADKVSWLINSLLEKADFAQVIVSALADGSIPTRVVHNDTKISNVLFTNDDKGLCVIDLDTVMPGSLLYDFGDAIRSGAANEPEWSDNFDKVSIREDLYEAFIKGYINGAGDIITEKEYDLLPMSAFILTYELAIRFLDDYLDNDRYFAPSKEGFNLTRAINQARLANDIFNKIDTLKAITDKYRTK